jgi:hypothetical protein
MQACWQKDAQMKATAIIGSAVSFRLRLQRVTRLAFHVELEAVRLLAVRLNWVRKNNKRKHIYVITN